MSEHTTVTVTPPVHYFGSAVALVTTMNVDGTSNITPISSTWSLGDHYVLGIANVNHGAANPTRTEECVINFADTSLVERVERLAPTTGAAPVPEQKRQRYRSELDKWHLAGFTLEPSTRVAPPRVAECPVQIEASLERALPLDETFAAYDVRVRAVHVHHALEVPGTNHIDIREWKPLYYTFRRYYGQGEHLSCTFKAQH